MVDHRCNALVEAMDGLLQQAKRAARGFRTTCSFSVITYQWMSELKHLLTSPFVPAGIAARVLRSTRNGTEPNDRSHLTYDTCYLILRASTTTMS